jgi:hypothetical protein
MTDTMVFFNVGLSCRNIKKLVGWLKLTGIGMEIQRMKDWPEAGDLTSLAREFHWQIDSSGSKIR